MVIQPCTCAVEQVLKDRPHGHDSWASIDRASVRRDRSHLAAGRVVRLKNCDIPMGAQPHGGGEATYPGSDDHNLSCHTQTVDSDGSYVQCDLHVCVR